MIRLIQRRLIVPRGDTGTFSIPVLTGKDSGDASIFTIFSPLTHRKIFEKVMENSDGVLKMDLTHGDTVNLPVGDYVWDIKFYTDPVFVDGKLVSGTEVDSYYSAFQLPICEIRETGDNLLMADDAPNSKLAPDQINYIDAAIVEIHNSMDTAVSSAAEASTSATSAETSASAAAASEQAAQSSQEAALASQQAAQAAASDAANSAATASQKAAQIETDLATKADKSEIPTLVSQLENDSGYLTQHQDISGKANVADLAAVATSGSYNDLLNKPFIPSAVSDLTDDSGHYTKPAGGIPASDLEETYLTSFTETDPTVPAWAKAAQKPIYTAQEVGALPADTVIPTVPTNVSAFTNDAGYLTQHQDISGKANSADLATVATSGSYEDLENKPTIPDVQINGDSIINNGVANIPIASDSTFGVIQTDNTYGTMVNGLNKLAISRSGSSRIKEGLDQYRPITPYGQHEATFYGLAKIAGVDMKNSSNTPGTYTTEAKTAIQNMLGVPSTSAIPTLVSQLTNDSGYLTSFTETDPTVPAWAKASTKPSYTAAEVGAPTVAEMNTAIGTAIGNVHQFELSIQQSLPTQDIDTHTIYLIPKTGDTNDVYDEYVYINNAWEMIGNTQIDLSNYATKSEIPIVPVTDVQVNGTSVVTSGVANVPLAGAATYGVVAANGTGVSVSNGYLSTTPAPVSVIKPIYEDATETMRVRMAYRPIVPQYLNAAVFYGLAKAAGDITQSQSDNAVGTYTTEAKTAIRTMLGVAASSDIPAVPVQDVQVNGTSIVGQGGIANVPIATAASDNFGVVKASPNNGINVSNGVLTTNPATSGQIKIGTSTNRPLAPATQHESAFYGLAKAAGDSTQSASNNPVGTYTAEAQAAIHSMLGVTDALASKLDAAEAGLKVVRLI